MNYKYKLPAVLAEKASSFAEFANGGAQATIKLKDGRVFNDALISNSTAIIALRGYESLPFEIDDIVDIYQSEEDKNPKERAGWDFWDEWK